MRLIDADMLIRLLEHSSETWAKNIPAIRNWWPHAVRIKDNIVALIKTVPTIEAEPVRHGRWESVPSNGIGGTARCSVCGKAIYGYHTMNYCPNCGAKMDE